MINGKSANTTLGLYPDNSLNSLDEHDSPHAEVDHAI